MFTDNNQIIICESGSSFLMMINVDPGPSFLAEERLVQAHSSLWGEAVKLYIY